MRKEWRLRCSLFRSLPLWPSWCFFRVTGERPVPLPQMCGGSPWPRSAGTGNREGAPSPARSCARSDQAGSLGTKEETPAAARSKKEKLQFQILSALLARICKLLAPDPICFGGTPDRSNRSSPVFFWFCRNLLTWERKPLVWPAQAAPQRAYSRHLWQRGF